MVPITSLGHKQINLFYVYILFRMLTQEGDKIQFLVPKEFWLFIKF